MKEENIVVTKIYFIFNRVIFKFQNIQKKSEKPEPNEVVLNLLVSSIVLGCTLLPIIVNLSYNWLDSHIALSHKLWFTSPND